MKKIGGVKSKFLSIENLHEAVNYLCRSAKRNKWTPSMKSCWDVYLSSLDRNLKNLYEKLNNRTYEFGKFKIFRRYESEKERVIYASYPEDQIVDRLYDLCLKYVFMEKKHIIHPNCYGSIEGKGQHELRQKIIKKIKSKKVYVAVCDTKQYYPTMSHSVLMRILESHIKDSWLLWLSEKTIDRMEGGKGLALGLASSNILGHIYHADIDWEMTLKFGMYDYYRFCDDKIMIHPDKKFLMDAVLYMKHLIEMHDQELKPTWRIVNTSSNQTFEFLGGSLNSDDARLKTYSRRRVENRFKKEMKKPFEVEKDYHRLTSTWAGIKGSLFGLDIKGLIRFWVLESKYKLFFNRLKLSMEYEDNQRKIRRKAKFSRKGI